MPSDANGVYSLPAGYLAVLGAKIRPSQHNPIFQDIAAALTERLLKNGNTPMSGPLQGYGGNAATPGFTFDGAENFGFFKSANGIGVSINGVQIFEFIADTAGTLRKGARYVGELFPWSRIAAPSLCVLPVGQTLSRVTYADLWTVAQAEIAAGSTFYNNGDGSTTFGVADLRGRGFRAPDNMGGSAAGRLTVASSGFPTTTLGGAGGSEAITLALANLPAGITSSGNNSISVTSANPLVKNATLGVNPGSASGTAVWNGGTSSAETSSNGAQAISVTSNNTGGLPHQNVGPTLIANFALFAGA